MKDFFLDRMAVVDLEDGKITCSQLGEGFIEKGELSQLTKGRENDLILACGSLTGSLAPAACLVNVCVAGKTFSLTGHFGRALRSSGFDVLVLTGSAPAPKALLLGGDVCTLVEVDSTGDVPSLRSHLLRHSQKLVRDLEPSLLMIGPAAFAGCKSPALVLDIGTVSNSFPAAKWFAEHKLLGLGLLGLRPYLSPIPPDHPLRQLVTPETLSAKNLSGLLELAGGVKTNVTIPIGRMIACHACTNPCHFYLKGAACTSLAALSALLEAGAGIDRLAEIFALSECLGIDPLSLTSLAKAKAMPTAVEDVTSAALPLPDGEGSKDSTASRLGICPFFLKRFPEFSRSLHEGDY